MRSVKLFLVIFCLVLFGLMNSADAATVTLSKVVVKRGNSLDVSWSGFVAPARMDVYRGSEAQPWRNANTTAPGSGTQNIGTNAEWDLRPDYTIQMSDNEGHYASSERFIVDSPPPVPTQSVPLPGTSFVKGASVTFSWSGPSGYSINRYHLRIVKGTDLNNDANLVYNSDTILGTSRAISTSNWDEGTYTWAVRAIKNCPDLTIASQFTYENEMHWGAYATRTLSIAPPPPDLDSPSRGSTLNDSTPDLVWSTSTSASYFNVQIAADSSFQNLVVNEPHWNTFNYTPPPLNDNTYWWRVRTYYGSWSDWSDVRWFTIDTQSGSSLELLSPAGGTSITNATVTFNWSSVPVADHYEIMVDNNAGFGSPEVHEPGIHTVNLTENTYQVTNWLPDNVYYWKVIAHLSDGSTIDSATGSFTYHLPVFEKPVFVPLFRLYNSSAKDHFYCTVPAQKDSAISSGYSYEKIECYISDRKFANEECGYLFRLYNPLMNTHFYTANEAEKDQRIINGYNYEGIVGFIYTSTGENVVPLEYLEHVGNTDHFYTISKFEADNATLPASGFVDRGVIAYVSPDGLKEPLVHSRPQANFGGVDLGSGAYRGLNNLDLLMKGRGPDLTFAHYYNSFNFNRLPMGTGWSHSLVAYATESIDGNVYVTWGNGTTSIFKLEADGYVDETGNHDLLERVDDGMNYGYNLTRKNQTTYQFRRFAAYPYSDNGGEVIVLKMIKDWAGHQITYDYQPNGTTVYDDMGRALKLTYYYPSGLLQKVEESVNGVTKRSVSFTYDNDGLLRTFVDANGQTTRYDYYNEPSTLRHHLLKSITYSKGNTVLIDYDTASGRVKEIRDQNSAPSKIEYTPSSGETAVTDPENNIFDYKHTSNMLTAYKGHEDTAWTTIDRTDTRNPNLPTHVKDKNGNTTDYEYDANGNLTKVINARGKIATYAYNDKNNITESTEFHDPSLTNPPKTTYSYDLSGDRLYSITNPENETIQLDYDANNQVHTITDGRGFSTTFTYDSYGNLEHVTDAEGNLTQYENDYAGRTVSVTDAEGIKTAFTYDDNDHPKDIMNYAKGGQTILRTISRFYDANGNLDTVHWANQGVSTQTQYTYDDRDRIESVVKPGNLDKVFDYYETDRLKTRTDYNNATTTYYYDDDNRLQKTLYPDQTNVVITRDDNGNTKTVTGKNGTSAFTYNNLNLIETSTDPYGKTVTYLYNDAGHISRITYPGVGKDVDYTYDSAGRLKTVTDWNNGSVQYFYDAAGNLERIERTNGITTEYAYDNASRLTGITEKDSSNATLWSYTFVLDGVGNHKSVDAVNEPLVGTVSPSAVTYTNDKATNRLLSNGSTTFTYDNNGNRKTSSDGGATTTYTWDYENRLSHMTTPGQSDIEYVYDGMGNRIAKVANGTTTRYVLDLNSPMSRVLAETDGNGVVTAYYIYGLGLVSRIAADGSRRFYHFNQRGDTVALSDDSGTVTDKYAFGEYGQLEASQGTTPNPFKFVGRSGVMDEGNDLYCMRARFYDAKVGRFLSEDPLGFGGGDWNLYAYVGGNPEVRIDAGGLSHSEEINHGELLMRLLGESAEAEQNYFMAEANVKIAEHRQTAISYAVTLGGPVLTFTNLGATFITDMVYFVKTSNHQDALKSGTNIGYELSTKSLEYGVQAIVNGGKSFDARLHLVFTLGGIIKDWFQGDFTP